MGLIGGIARTAVVAGTATAVSNRVSRRQYNRWAGQDQQQYYQAPPPARVYAPRGAPPPRTARPPRSAPAPPSAPPPQSGGPDPIAQLKDLADLKAKGILTEQEFAAQKARILGS
jgi:hypothetical protein